MDGEKVGCRVSLDGVDAVVVPLSYGVPVDAAGYWLRRTASATVVSELLGDGGPWWGFVEGQRSELVRAGTQMARWASVTAVVLSPAGVSAERTALACTVAELLQARRGDGWTVVVCAVCPPLGLGRSAVPHEVQVTAGGGPARVERVWEIVRWADLAVWRAGLVSWAVSA